MKKRLAIGGLVGAIALVAALRSRGEPDGATLAWPLGQRYVYTLAWQARTHMQGDATIGIPATDGDVDLDGQLELRSLGRRGDTTLLAISVPQLERHRWSVLGRELFPDDATVQATFTGRAAYISLRADGSLAAVRFDPDAPPLFRAAMSAIAPQAIVTLRTGADWDVVEQGPSGRARVHYHRHDDALVRDRVSYRTLDALPAGLCSECRPTLSASASIDLADGHVASLDDRETLASRRPDGSTMLDVQSHFAIALVDVHAGAGVEAAIDEAHLVDATTSYQREALERRIDGLTGEALLDQLRISALTGKLGVNNTWAVRAVALLQLHPELCDQLRDLFEDPEINLTGRGMILDLLTSAGSGPAQEAMRAILESETARTDPTAYLAFVERFSIVEQPAAESAPFIDKLRADAATTGDRPLETAALYTLGSLAGHLADSGDLATARGYTARFRKELAEARTPDAKRTLLAALGNAGLPDDVGAIAALATDRDPEVRAQVAVALRDAKTPEAEAALGALAADPEATVARTAWTTLGHRELELATVTRLAGVVRDGRLPADAGGEATSVLGPHLADNPKVADALIALAQQTSDNALKARIDEILHPGR